VGAVVHLCVEWPLVQAMSKSLWACSHTWIVVIVGVGWDAAGMEHAGVAAVCWGACLVMAHATVRPCVHSIQSRSVAVESDESYIGPAAALLPAAVGGSVM
jgi:hypothetical protein